MTLEKFTHEDHDGDILLVQKFRTGDVVINVNDECVHVPREIVYSLVSFIQPVPKPVLPHENIGSIPA